MQSKNTETLNSPAINDTPINLRIPLVLLLLVLILSIVVAALLSVCIGVAGSSFSEVWSAVTNFSSESTIHQVIRELRFPRVVGAALVGAALALSGAIMQGIGNNPFADTGLLGINAGAGFAVSLGMVLFVSASFRWVMLLSFLGATLGVVCTYGLGVSGRKNATLIRLLLAGAAVSAFLNALSQGLSLVFGLAKNLSFWQSGSLNGITWEQIRIVSPWMLIAIVFSIFLAPSLSVLALGEDSATGLGLPIKTIRLLGIVISLVLAGCSVSIAGGISFLGLLIPHIERFLVGADYRRILPVTALSGSLLMILADLCGRMINAPYDTPVGALVSVIGAPFFLILAYRKRKEGLGT